MALTSFKNKGVFFNCYFIIILQYFLFWTALISNDLDSIFLFIFGFDINLYLVFHDLAAWFLFEFAIDNLILGLKTIQRPLLFILFFLGRKNRKHIIDVLECFEREVVFVWVKCFIVVIMPFLKIYHIELGFFYMLYSSSFVVFIELSFLLILQELWLLEVSFFFAFVVFTSFTVIFWLFESVSIQQLFLVEPTLDNPSVFYQNSWSI